jgi:hypothetical protein
MAAGDVLLFARKSSWANFRRDPFGTVMCALIHLTTRSKWNHAAIALSDTEMIEATNRGVVVSPIRSQDEIAVVPAELPIMTFGCALTPPLNDCPNQFYGNDLEETLAVAAAAEGTRYGYFNAFWCGLRNLIPGAAHIKTGKTIICSELVSLALMYAGHRWDKDTALVSPGDLAEHFGVNRK